MEGTYDLNELRKVDTAAKRAYSWDDMGNGQRFYDEHGKDIRFVKTSSLRKGESGGWLIWTGVWSGTHWQRDETGQIDRMAMQTANNIRQDLLQGEGDAEGKSARSWLRYTRSVKGRQNMLESARPIGATQIRLLDLDKHEWLLNCSSGTINLSTGEVLPHRRQDLITRLIPLPYDLDAQCPTWERFIDSVTQGDTALATYLQKAVGYSLTGSTREQCLFFLYGEGSNGKSTFMGTLQELLGDYTTTAAIGMLHTKKNDRNTTDVADLVNCRLLCSYESGKEKQLDEELVKQMTGGDRMRARFLYSDNFEFTPKFKLWFCANHRPALNDHTEAMRRRVKVIPFNAHFTDRTNDPRFKKDENLAEKLRAELPGILAWAVRGCLLWQQDGLGEPRVVKVASADYMASTDVLGTFFRECCKTDPTYSVKSTDLYACYSAWCKEAKEQPLTLIKFGLELQSRGSSKIKSHGVMKWAGIRLDD